MKRTLKTTLTLLVILLSFLLLPLSSCESESVFTVAENGNVVSPDGVEYKFLANEGELSYLGELEFVASVKGEDKTSMHMGEDYQTGMFRLKSAENDNILIRVKPNNEFYYIYRKASLPEFDYSISNIIRLEYADSDHGYSSDPAHATCGKGIAGKEAVADFLAEIKNRPTAKDAGLYDLVTVPDSGGMLENCTVSYSIQGYYEDEPLLVHRFTMHNFNDLAYSLGYDGAEHVLPKDMLDKLKG